MIDLFSFRISYASRTSNTIPSLMSHHGLGVSVNLAAIFTTDFFGWRVNHAQVSFRRSVRMKTSSAHDTGMAIL